MDNQKIICFFFFKKKNPGSLDGEAIMSSAQDIVSHVHADSKCTGKEGKFDYTLLIVASGLLPRS